MALEAHNGDDLTCHSPQSSPTRSHTGDDIFGGWLVLKSAAFHKQYSHLTLGKPDPTTFPVTSITIKLKNEDKPVVLEEAELREGLQYGLPAGSQMLIEVR